MNPGCLLEYKAGDRDYPNYINRGYKEFVTSTKFLTR